MIDGAHGASVTSLLRPFVGVRNGLRPNDKCSERHRKTGGSGDRCQKGCRVCPSLFFWLIIASQTPNPDIAETLASIVILQQ